MAKVPNLVVQIRADVATSALYRILGLADYDLGNPLSRAERLTAIAEICREAIRQGTEVAEDKKVAVLGTCSRCGHVFRRGDETIPTASNERGYEVLCRTCYDAAGSSVR